jgi:hypothetical protein
MDAGENHPSHKANAWRWLKNIHMVQRPSVYITG